MERIVCILTCTNNHDVLRDWEHNLRDRHCGVCFQGPSWLKDFEIDCRESARLRHHYADFWIDGCNPAEMPGVRQMVARIRALNPGVSIQILTDRFDSEQLSDLADDNTMIHRDGQPIEECFDHAAGMLAAVPA